MSNVYYRFGRGWVYKFRGAERGPHKTAKEAALAMKAESFAMRSIDRANEGRKPTLADGIFDPPYVETAKGLRQLHR
jgi:hypothetical protein